MVERSDTARVLAPPPVLFLVALAAGLGLDWVMPSSVVAVVPAGVRWTLAMLVAGLGVAVALLGIREFLRAGTSPEPWHPATALVAAGVYRRLRNPMYVGLVALLLGVGLAMAGAFTLLAAGGLALALHHGVVKREERYLLERFGEPYRRYLAEVPRYGWPPC